MRRLRVHDIAVLTLVVLLLAFVLAPAVARLQRSPGDAQCQSNLRRWAGAMALYLGDNHHTYPTNRRGTVPYALASSIQLTPDQTQSDMDGTPRRFMYGVNWVEALYPYLRAAASTTGQDWKAFRKCPNARNMGQLPGGPLAATSYVTYAFNYNLVEQPENVVRGPESLMMLREMDRRVNSVLRPTTLSADATVKPLYPFLTASDAYISPSATDQNRHATGSYIAFADGHVRYFTSDYYPANAVWDAATQRWYNVLPYYPSGEPIAITP